MNLTDKRVLVTGAGGGIGRELCTELVQRGTRLCMLARSSASVTRLRTQFESGDTDSLVLQADVTDRTARRAALRTMFATYGGIDVLVNLAGMLDFRLFNEADADCITKLLQVNLEAPMQLVREVLPSMLAQQAGSIVNIGSTFGSIAFPGFATYSASKFALRGFSQALRRELVNTGVAVTYVAPRAVRTTFNPPAIHSMAAEGMMHMDEASWVARRIVRAIERGKDEVYIGFAESVYSRVNGVLPRLVDRSLRRSAPRLARFARGTR
jgi:short-subunit dehydrogenase